MTRIFLRTVLILFLIASISWLLPTYKTLSGIIHAEETDSTIRANQILYRFNPLTAAINATPTTAQHSLLLPTWTPASQSTITPVTGSTPVTTNAAWTPQLRNFNGVEMVLVPTGCFLMGSEDGDIDEQPVHEVCFSEPFWIDRFEVTNEQFNRLNGVARRSSRWTGENRPRDMITWFEARDFCEQRDSRLPTEAELEYAARGPDSLVYPWGNEFVPDNAVYGGHSGYEAADVGEDRRRGSRSWVGAYDLSGNVLEWASTIYDNSQFTGEFPYPYAADDGREDLERTHVSRVVRGGGFFISDDDLRSANRAGTLPGLATFNIGFRCALSF